MNVRRVLVIGSSLFAETLAQVLGHSASVVVVGTAPTMDAALTQINSNCPDVVILAAFTTSPNEITNLLVNYPELPIVRADLATNEVQVITSRSITARSADLLEALSSLPRHCE